MPEHRHLTTVVYHRPWRALFRRRWLVRCFTCDLREPFTTRDEAHEASKELDRPMFEKLLADIEDGTLRHRTIKLRDSPLTKRDGTG